MRLLSPYFTGALIAGALALGGYIWWLRATTEALVAENAALRLQAEGRAARIENIEQDKESDRVIDAISDDDLRIVPDHWMRPGPG